MHILEMGENMKEFNINNRRYLGSKYKLIDFIHKVVDNNCQDITSVCDLFAGTGVVGYSFNKDYDIIVNDTLTTNEVAYYTFFDDEEVDKDKLMNLIDHYNSLSTNEDNYYSINFADTYLSKENMSKVGYIRDNIDSLYDKHMINFREKNILICSLIYAIDRIANTVGHYDAYRKNGDLNQQLVLSFPNLEEDQYNTNNQIYNLDANELVKNIKADLVYIDPPYNSRQFCDAYHFLENVALNTKPEVKGVARKMDRKNLKSVYCSSKAPLAYEELIENIDAKYILVSYNNMGKQGDPRSNAKISDKQILEILKTRGEVKIFEEEYGAYTTGKTNLDNHKERLFLCTVGKKDESLNNMNINEFIKSPLNFTGGKYKILPQLVSKFPSNIDVFYDVFCGGVNVGINMNCNHIICVDIDEHVISLLEYLKQSNSYDLIKHLDNLIEQYGLSNTYKYGYAYYECESSHGVGKYNKEAYTKLKNDYNLSPRDDLFLLLIIYGFNNQIRFNNQGVFNLPVGKRDFNASLRKKLEAFMDKMHTENIYFICQNFRDMDIEEISQRRSFLYLDPPYYLGDAAYNENGGWTLQDEKDLLEFLNQCDALGIKFALSNVIEHKGQTHELLINWCLDNSYNINYISKTYSNASYHIKDKTAITKEVLITNY